MELRSSHENGIAVIEIIGKLDANASYEAESKINEVINSDGGGVILDLKETTFVSSSGLRVFLAASKKMATKEGLLALCCANKVVQEVFHISGFDTILNIKSTRDKAIQDLRASNSQLK